MKLVYAFESLFLFVLLHSDIKNPLYMVLLEGHTTKMIAILAFQMVGGAGFEPATSTV
jgi:hypothetical protein